MGVLFAGSHTSRSSHGSGRRAGAWPACSARSRNCLRACRRSWRSSGCACSSWRCSWSRTLADYAASYLSVSVEQAAMRDLRRKLFAHLQTLSLSYLPRPRTGDDHLAAHQRRRGAARLARRRHQQPAQGRADVARLPGHGIRGVVAAGAGLDRWCCRRRRWRWSTIGRKMRKRSGRAQERDGRAHERAAGEHRRRAAIVKAFGIERFEEGRFERPTPATSGHSCGCAASPRRSSRCQRVRHHPGRGGHRLDGGARDLRRTTRCRRSGCSSSWPRC